MFWILQFIGSHRAAFSYLLTVLLSLWMLSSGPERQARISRGLMFSVFYPVHYTLSLSSHIGNIFAENRRLRAEVASLSMRLSRIEEEASENQRLRQILGIAESFPYDLVPARVMIREPAQLFRSVVIDAGQKHGIDRFMPVIGTKGVAGKVVQVLGGISQVQLLQDPAARTSVMLKKNRTVGILETTNGRDYFVRYRPHVECAEGDTILTSGKGGIFPSGINVGIIKGFHEDSDPLFRRVMIEPFEDFEHLENVFVLRLSPQWSAFRTEVDSIEFQK